jgi:hypothetical protein
LLFDDIQRSYLGTKRDRERPFEFLNRSGRPVIARARNLLESWFGNLSECDQKRLKRDLVSRDERQFKGAFFELYVHELLRRTGHSVSLHPSLENTTRNPDFRSTPNVGASTIVEATVVTEQSNNERRLESHVKAVEDEINARLHSSDYLLELGINGSLNESPAVGKLCRSISKYLESLNYDEVLSRFEAGIYENREFRLNRDGSSASVTVIPKPRTCRLISHNENIVAFPQPKTFCVTSRAGIRDALKDKAGHYGEITEPYVIAVNVVSEESDEEELVEAIYGREGLWPLGRAAHTRVSAVLVLAHLDPYSVATTPVRLFHNPNASTPYLGPLAILTQVFVHRRRLRSIEGSAAWQIFGLSPNWPRSEAGA